MKKKLSDYILQVKKEMDITIRCLKPLEDEQMEILETYLDRYDLIKISSPKKTIHQKWALGFSTPVNSSVWIVEATLGIGIPLSGASFRLAEVLGYNEADIVVHLTSQDLSLPETNTASVAKVNNDDKFVKEYKKKIEDDLNGNVDHSEYYGEDYNNNLLKAIADLKKETNKKKK